MGNQGLEQADLLGFEMPPVLTELGLRDGGPLFVGEGSLVSREVDARA